MLSKKFFSAGKVILTDGTIGLFANLNVSSTFQFSNGASAASTSLGSGITPRSGFGPNSRGIFIFDSQLPTKSYAFSNAAVTTSASLIATGLSGGAVGNKTLGIVAGSRTSNATSKFTYSPESVASGTALGTTGNGGHITAFGSKTVGIFITPVLSPQLPNKYTYAGDAVSTTTSLGYSPTPGGAISNGVVGLICTNSNSTAPIKYTFSSDSSSSGSVLGDLAQTGCGTSTNGFFALATGNHIAQYTYSGDVVTSGYVLANASITASAANGTLGVNVY